MQVRFWCRGADVPPEEWEIRLRLVFRGEDLGDQKGAPNFCSHSYIKFDDDGVAGVYVRSRPCPRPGHLRPVLVRRAATGRKVVASAVSQPRL